MSKRKYVYVSEGNKFMRQAKRVAKEKSLDPDWPTGVVVVKDGRVIGRGANGSEHHRQFGCERKRRGVATGERYELCPGCDPKNHGEPRAIADARVTGSDPVNGEVYLWGHWWCCEPCWQVMEEAGIDRVYLLRDAKMIFKEKRRVQKAKVQLGL